MPTKIICTEVPPGSAVPTAALSNPSTRIVHLVRHGEATHNKYAATVPQPACACVSGGSCAYKNEAHVDASLTVLGRKQASAAGASLLRAAAPDVAFVSPLARTLETCSIAIGVGGGVGRVVADERLRERYGVHCCDQRAAKSVQEARFPSVNFMRIAPGDDALHEKDVRETHDHVAERSREFFLELADVPEKSIAVFSHSAFFRETMRAAFTSPDQNVTRKFSTGEVRLVVLEFVKD